MTAELRVLELYSGIGGMHYALKESGVAAQVVAAIDVNTTANEIYRHNFPDTPLWPKTIEGISLEEFNKLSFDMILMSPPCQPFTRIGLQGDTSDPRTKSFLYILDLLPRLATLPRFILLENVKGFETSSARESLVNTLKDCSYTFQEILVSPTSLGIPNSRLRYFLIAKAPPGSFSFETSSEIVEGFPLFKSSSHPAPAPPTSCPSTCPNERQEAVPADPEGVVLYKLETTRDADRKSNQNADLSVRQIQEFLELGSDPGGEEVEQEVSHYLLPPKTLLRYALLMDIVTPTCRRSVCFTKGYGHYVEGTGSVLQSCVEAEMHSVFRGLAELSPGEQEQEEKLRRLRTLRLRYFTPREIANLMGFPSSLAFPEGISTKQRYRVLGNSLNVRVVATLIQLMVS
ncbi:tRNA (cytosine(38)-C(5))-methyltransferase [Merluccius polli]|uniref:tRNA (cytosine(38)-C(5))-methyltransferase n=1 Tax=Merluccius polli TaxID=89951 RepID=A0AA47MNH4_MERPO|nr:tRNA (cytosine(38)-C(5))-methyltransferase [Merluccius polli]